MVESLGATIVIDEQCTGSRYFWDEVEPDSMDPLMAIAERYVERPACPSKDSSRRERIDHTLQLARDYTVHGAILIQQEFCNPHGLDVPALKTALEEELDIPGLLLKLDAAEPVRQSRVRCEAFLETLRKDRRFE
jgi:benzoyl-CoA reductase subunit C